mmetsp:Transcript_61736/g.91703  ORF Transcript_61736/g.91703 Transcript_61736/m.91703 type:complete len:168 (-) Transcript_61736:38-541(-)
MLISTMSIPQSMALLAIIAALSTSAVTSFAPAAFVTPTNTRTNVASSSSLSMSFFADSSDYKGDDYDEDGATIPPTDSAFGGASEDEMESPVTEETPVPMSKNNQGNRWVAFVFDRAMDKNGLDVMELHERRVSKTEDHVLFCRMSNLYNETFNYNSMVDVVWSYPM